MYKLKFQFQCVTQTQKGELIVPLIDSYIIRRERTYFLKLESSF